MHLTCKSRCLSLISRCLNCTVFSIHKLAVTLDRIAITSDSEPPNVIQFVDAPRLQSPFLIFLLLPEKRPSKLWSFRVENGLRSSKCYEINVEVNTGVRVIIRNCYQSKQSDLITVKTKENTFCIFVKFLINSTFINLHLINFSDGDSIRNGILISKNI